jgi:hypothetical protein
MMRCWNRYLGKRGTTSRCGRLQPSTPTCWYLARSRSCFASFDRHANLVTRSSDDQIFPGRTRHTNKLIRDLTRRHFYVGYYGSTNYEPGVSSHSVLMHDPLLRTVRTLVPWVVKQMRDLGYRPVTFGECQGQPRRNQWYFPPVRRPEAFNNRTWICPEEQEPPRCLPWQTRCLAKPGAVTLPRPWR